jgi:hypothetical protein
MEDEINALFIQRVSREKLEDRNTPKYKFIGIVAGLFLIYGILVSLRTVPPLKNYLMALFILIGVVLAGIMFMRLVFMPEEIKLIVYPDGLYFYTSVLWGKYITLKDDEILSITKVLTATDRILNKIPDDEYHRKKARFAEKLEEASTLFPSVATYTVTSTKARLPILFWFFMSKEVRHSWTLLVEIRNEEYFLRAIKRSKFADRLDPVPISSWEEFYTK